MSITCFHDELNSSDKEETETDLSGLDKRVHGLVASDYATWPPSTDKHLISSQAFLYSHDQLVNFLWCSIL